MPMAWPLIGRREELEFVARTMARGGRGGIVLAGAAGVGKSRLAAECLEMAQGNGFATSSAIATHAAASIPFGALAHLLPETFAAGPGLENVLRAAADALVQQQSGDLRLVLAVDDAHLLDDQSAALVHHLTLTAKAFPILTLRTGEPAPDSIVGLWKDEVCERLEVQPLSREELAQLLEAVLGSQFDATTGARLWELTRGNPLFLRELIGAALGDGSLVQREGVWRWKGSLPASPRLVEVIGRRLEGLEEHEQEAMEIVAVGEPVELAILDSLAGPAALRGLERRGLIEETAQRRRIKTRTSHPFYGEILRAQLSPAHAAVIYRRLAEALERTGWRRAGDLLRVAAWRLAAGNCDDPELYLEAAQRALVLYDYRLAERLARAATEAGGGTEAAHALAGALVGEGRFEEADHVLERLVAQAAEDAPRAGAALARANNLYWDLGRIDDAFRVLSSAEAAVADVDLRDELRAGAAHLLLVTARPHDAIAAGRPILDRVGASPRATVEALGAVGLGLIYRGRPNEAVEILNRHVGHVEPVLHQLPYGPTAVATYRALAAFFSGRLAVGVAELERERNEMLRRGPEWAPTFLAGLAGLLLRMQGKVRSATRSLREAIALARETNIAGHLALFLVELAHCRALQGDSAGAQATMREAESSRMPGHNLFDAWFFFPKIWTYVCDGRVPAGITEALAAADALERGGVRGLEAIALHDVVRLGQPGLVAERLSRLAAACDGLLMPTLARHTEALVESDALALEEVSERFERMGAFLLAAEAAAEAAQVHRRNGSRSPALAAGSRAAVLAGLCEGARTPALVDIEGSLPLSAREREVAVLACRGLSNREIAERLVLSLRTVGNHLQHVYSKLGVTGREELHDFPELALTEGERPPIRYP